MPFNEMSTPYPTYLFVRVYITLQNAWEGNSFCFISHIKSRKLPQGPLACFSLYTVASLGTQRAGPCVRSTKQRRTFRGSRRRHPITVLRLRCARDTWRALKGRFEFSRPEVEPKILHFLTSFQVTPMLPVPGPTLDSWESILPGETPVLLCHY